MFLASGPSEHDEDDALMIELLLLLLCYCTFTPFACAVPYPPIIALVYCAYCIEGGACCASVVTGHKAAPLFYQLEFNPRGCQAAKHSLRLGHQRP